MPNLSNTILANNWNRAQNPNSQYGTRRLQFYKIEIVGYDINDEPGWDNDDQSDVDSYRTTYDEYNSTEYLESPKSILYPILRGIAQVAEIYLNGEPDSDTSSTGPSTSTYLIVALTADTVIDGEDNNFASTSKNLVTAISQSISEYSVGNVLVTSVRIQGEGFNNVHGPNS